MIYLYCFPLGAKWSKDEPTAVDLSTVEVIRVNGDVIEISTPSGSWEPVDEADYISFHGGEWHE